MSRDVPASRTPPAVHFIGFRGEEYWSAVRIWGKPDFIHESHDPRSYQDRASGDVVVFGPKAAPDYIVPYNVDKLAQEV